jgi:hypothetical protein
MGAEFSFSTEIPVRKLPGIDGQGAKYCLPRNCISPHQKDRSDSENGENGENRCSNTHSEIRKCIKLERPFPHAVPGWRIHKKQTRKDKIPTHHSPKSTRAGLTGLLDQSPGKHCFLNSRVYSNVMKKIATCNWMAWMKIPCSNS